ncbi:DUF4331 family protein [Lacinutrix sp. Bg11-31]|uniref:DUF4331 family protein n=1 Tax=Lacinutrix sp. Bg11-31 TaxID=2057808 RepID=UPI000C306A47|nr:DUF4331 family protein [Lacinutrix sp. Bg11-31]AUC80961.1 molecular chaperone DnaK [Lacinutrix sp. Bg11-31]
MKKFKILLGASAIAVTGFFMVAADHIDAPAVAGGTSDITDFYAFQGQDSGNIAFVVNVQGLLSPTASGTAAFDENVLVEINIDTDGDAIQDLVIQAIPRDGKMYVFGPFASSSTSLNSTVNDTASRTVVDITPYGATAITATSTTGITAFAGPRDDPFFMDFAQYGEIIAGNATSFNNPGADTFAGSNVMSIIIEVPKAMIGGTGNINTWVETKSK